MRNGRKMAWCLEGRGLCPKTMFGDMKNAVAPDAGGGVIFYG